MTWEPALSPAFWDAALPEAGSFMVSFRLPDGPTEVDPTARDAIEGQIATLRVDFLPDTRDMRQYSETQASG